MSPTTTTNGSRSSGPAKARRSADPELGAHGPEVQAFGTLRLLPIGLPAATRERSVKLLNGSWPTR